MNPRLQPLPEDMWTDEHAEVLARVGADANLSGGPAPFNIFTTLAHHPKLLKRWMVFGNHVLNKSTLSPRDRELLILRTAWNCRAEYEWGHHVAIAEALGLDDEEIAAVAGGPADDRWGADEKALLEAADDLHSESSISEATWQRLGRHLSIEQILDLIFAVGQYHTVAFALNSCGVELEEGYRRFPGS
ncbi:MAG: carboxymuconolactone decarboxylase family protein [Actinobacteria bacterium]|nr:MAG: carboxymuconolactone decarboxylase family protein [Actinomycetota bacterium]RIK05128.1 MAG: carboxymuconolactone decarboxylase family protein [Acidobacteriota bacterium]